MIQISQNRCAPMIVPYCDHLAIIKFGATMFFSTVVSVNFSFLMDTVLHVIKLCSDKKMIGINARGVIAFMEDLHSLWYFSVMQFVAQTMGQDLLTPNLYRTIPMRFPTDPYKATGRIGTSITSESFLWCLGVFESIFSWHLNPPYRVHLLAM